MFITGYFKNFFHTKKVSVAESPFRKLLLLFFFFFLLFKKDVDPNITPSQPNTSHKLSKLSRKAAKNKKKDDHSKITDDNYKSNDKLNHAISLNNHNYYQNNYDNDDSNYPSAEPKKLFHHGEYRYASTDELKQKLFQLKQQSKLGSLDNDSEEESDTASSGNYTTTALRPSNLNASQQTIESNNSFRSINSRTPSPINYPQSIELKSPAILITEELNNKILSNGNPNRVVVEVNKNVQLKVPLVKFRSVSNSCTSTSLNVSTTIATVKTLTKNESTSTEQVKQQQNVRYVTSGTNTDEVERISVATNTDVEMSLNGIDKNVNMILKNVYYTNRNFIVVLLKAKNYFFHLEKFMRIWLRLDSRRFIDWNGVYSNRIQFFQNEFIVVQKIFSLPRMVMYPEFNVSCFFLFFIWLWKNLAFLYL
jgi:hypothetical protein